MTYEEFKDHVVDVIKDYLPEEYRDADVNINQIVKNNETLDGLVIQVPGQNVSPTIYLNSFYDQYRDGKDMEDILDKLAEMRVAHNQPELLNQLNLGVDDLTDYEKVKESLIAHVVGVKGNEELLEKRPHVIKEDMAIMYKIALNDEMTVPITNELFNVYHVDLEEFHEKAMENISMQVTVTSMSQTIAEMMGSEVMEVPPEKDMIIISNESRVNGAIGIFDRETMDAMAEKYGDFILMPSSVHESLIVPEAAGLSVADAMAMVKEVNETQVEPQDRLTDNVYKYDKEAHELRICMEDPEMEQVRELYKDERIVISETDQTVKVTNMLETDIQVYSPTLADTLDLSSDEPVIVLYGNEDISWENTSRGFTGEVVSALKEDINENRVSSASLDETERKRIKMETQNLALVD